MPSSDPIWLGFDWHVLIDYITNNCLVLNLLGTCCTKLVDGKAWLDLVLVVKVNVCGMEDIVATHCHCQLLDGIAGVRARNITILTQAFVLFIKTFSQCLLIHRLLSTGKSQIPRSWVPTNIILIQ